MVILIMVGDKHRHMSHNTITKTDSGFRFTLSSEKMLLPAYRTDLQRIIENCHESGELDSNAYQQLSRVYFSQTEQDTVFTVGYVTSGLYVSHEDTQIITANTISQDVDSESYSHPSLAPDNPIRITIPDEQYVREHGEFAYDDIPYLRQIQTQIEKNKIILNKAKSGDTETLEYKTPETYIESREMIDRNKTYKNKLEEMWKELVGISYIALMTTKVGSQHDALSWDVDIQDMALVELVDYYSDETVCKRCGAVGDDDFVNTHCEIEYEICSVCCPNNV